MLKADFDMYMDEIESIERMLYLRDNTISEERKAAYMAAIIQCANRVRIEKLLVEIENMIADEINVRRPQ